MERKRTGVAAIVWRSLVNMSTKPIYLVGFFLLPLLTFVMLTSLMESGLPTKVPAGIVDHDGTPLSRDITQSLAGMQLVDLVETPTSFTEARHRVQEGKIFGFFMIPENFQADLMAGKSPEITFYTNMTYYVPGSLLFKTFKATAVYAKAGVAVKVLDNVGVSDAPTSLLQPVNIGARGIGNPWLNYGVYLSNSFIPAALQLMIMLMTCYTLGEEMKRRTSPRLLRMAGGSPYKAVFATLLPQTLTWIVIALFMQVWLFKFNHYPMNGSWWWMSLSQVMFVLASQGFALFFFTIVPNLRLSLSICALLGVLSFSLAAFSFPVESMYPALGIFSWILPTRYNFLIYIDQALNGRDIFYSRVWFVCYIIFMILPIFTVWRLRKEFAKPVYAP
ncbi:MAG: ABC transporter permease [Muribaculaceae bacterium]|nr:ABC transporter permease [Muribaculaceae bacterium]